MTKTNPENLPIYLKARYLYSFFQVVHLIMTLILKLGNNTIMISLII